MPRILALGCSDEALANLRADNRNDVVSAFHGGYSGGTAPSGFGPPSSFDIVIHDCERMASRAGAKVVPDSYVAETMERGAISVTLLRSTESSSYSGHLRGWLARTQGGYEHPALSPDRSPRAIFLEPFLAESSALLGDRVIARGASIEAQMMSPPALSMVSNQYDECVIGLLNERTIGLPAPDDDLRAGELVAAFVTRVVFQMYPTVFAREYRTSRVAALEGELAVITETYRAAAEQYRRAIAEEQQFVARHAPLAQTMDEALKLHLKDMLEEVCAVHVRDLDHSAEGPKTADLWIAGTGLLIETKGSRTRNATRSYVEVLDDHAAAFAAAGHDVKGKLLVFNGQLARPIAERAETFAPDVVALAKESGVCLATGLDLLRALEAVRDGSTSTQQLMGGLAAPGRFVAPPPSEAGSHY